MLQPQGQNSTVQYSFQTSDGRSWHAALWRAVYSPDYTVHGSPEAYKILQLFPKDITDHG
jgi:hypothetical protein